MLVYDLMCYNGLVQWLAYHQVCISCHVYHLLDWSVEISHDYDLRAFALSVKVFVEHFHFFHALCFISRLGVVGELLHILWWFVAIRIFVVIATHIVFTVQRSGKWSSFGFHSLLLLVPVSDYKVGFRLFYIPNARSRCI